MGVRHRLAKLSVSADGASAAEVAELTKREQELSAQLGRAKVEAGKEQPWYEMSQLRKVLPAASVYIELVRFAPANKPVKAVYLAWVVPPAGKGDVRLFDLGSTEQIDQCVADVRQELSRAPEYLKGLDIEQTLGTASPDLKFRQALDRLALS